MVDDEPNSETPRFVVCGDNPLALRLVSELTHRYGVAVTVILPSAHRQQGPAIAQIAGVQIVEAPRPTADAFAEAGLAQAAALALMAQDDAGNMDAALLAQEASPTLRIVVRMFNPSLAHGILALLHDGAALSESALAAPGFVAAALGEGTPTYLRMPGRTLVVARRQDVPPFEVVAGLAVRVPGGQPELLPEDESRADVVLAEHTRAHISAPTARHRRHPLRLMSIMVGRQLRLILAVMCGLLFVASAVLTAVRHVNWWQALYLAVLAMFGGAQPDLGVPAIEQALEAALTVLSVALVPLVTAAVVDAVVNARLTWAGTGPVEARHGHVVVVGLGNVGTRVLEALHDFGVDVVAIDQREQARGVRVARDLGIPVVVGDATQEGTLRAAWVDTCQALIVVSTDDVSNLETALLGRSITADLRVVVRLFDGDFATRVERAFGLTLSRSVSSLAAPVFAAAMMGRAVVDAIPIRRRVLLVAELPVRAGSQVEGQPASIIHCPHEYRLLAIHTGRGDQLLWSPPRGRRLTRTDRVIVVATREGLGRLLAQCAEGPVTGRSRPVVALDVVTQAIPRPRDDDRALGTGEPAG